MRYVLVVDRAQCVGSWARLDLGFLSVVHIAQECRGQRDGAIPSRCARSRMTSTKASTSASASPHYETNYGIQTNLTRSFPLYA
jgi:hypothetical protein